MTTHAAPPRLARWLLNRALAGPARSAIAGDIEEEFAAYVAPRLSPRAARRWYWRQTLLSIAACVRGPDAPEAAIVRAKDSRMSLARRFEELRDDTIGALRQMRRAPGFTTVAATTLALGIGANCAIFALVDATLLRPLPVREPDRLVMLSERSEASANTRVSPRNLLDWRDRSRTLASAGGYLPRVGAMVLANPGGTADTVPRQWVTAGFFDVIGARTIAGRTFSADDDAREAAAVVLTESFWRARFGGDRGVVGRALVLDGEPYTVLGVVSDDAQLLGRTSIWALVTIDRPEAPRGAYFLQGIGRLKPAVSLEAARADLSAVAAGLAREHPATNTGRGVTIEPMHDALIGSELRLTSLLFLGVVGFVLLLCCANVASLLLARATARGRELAIRAALGAGRARIVRQLLTESLVLAVLGGLLGLGVGAAILAVAPAVVPEGLLPPAIHLAVDLRLAAFCGGTAILVGLLFGVAPAWQATTRPSGQAIESDGRTVTGHGRLRGLLVAGEVAAAILLLVGGGLLLRSLLVVENVDRGFRTAEALTMLVDPLSDRYPTDEAMLQFLDAVEREVVALPNVASVAWASQLPSTGSRGRARDTLFEIVGDAPVAESQRPITDRQMVSPSYFRTLDLALVSGRGFSDRDTAASPRVCIVNEAFVSRYLAGRSPIGVRLALRPASQPKAAPKVSEIVGVARHVRSRPDEREPMVQVYVPLAQEVVGDVYLLVRPATGASDALVAPVRAAIGRVDREQLVGVREIFTLADLAWTATDRYRFRATMVATFAGLALVLAMAGVFGTSAYTVQQRLRDFAVRRALGATSGDVLRLVAAGVAPVFGLGLLAGVLAAVALGRVLTTVLYGVDPVDPLTFGTAAGVLALACVLAVAVPARRALRVDPAQVLRGS